VSDWSPPDLSGTVAVVTGSTRGVGRGIALVLGDCGATVYVTGRSTVEDAAAEVTARGGRGIAARTDHTDDAQVAALFERVRSEQGRLDLLVANAWGGYEGYDHASFSDPFWEQPLERWDVMFTAGVRAHFAAARAAAPLMIERGDGLMAFTGGFAAGEHYLGQLPYDVQKAAVDRMIVAMAFELREHGVAAAGIFPGFTRTERVVEAFAAGGAEPPPETHSAEFCGRAVASLAADPERFALSGALLQTAEYALRYGFTDVDGRTIEPFVLPDRLRL
jgi:NAD(P)-dependent dehydrogenase (short-subunit alcohol dehydrogenase family)